VRNKKKQADDIISTLFNMPTKSVRAGKMYKGPFRSIEYDPEKKQINIDAMGLNPELQLII